MPGWRLPACLLAAVLTIHGQGENLAIRAARVLQSSEDAEQARRAAERKDFAQLQRLLANAEAQRPANLAELLSLHGAVAFVAGDMNRSVEAFSESARLQPLSDVDNFTFAMAWVKSGRAEKAREILAALAQAQPRNALYPYWLGKLDYDQRRYEEAVLKLKAAAVLEPDSARILDSLGLALDMQGQQQPARDALERAAALNRTQTHPSPWPPHDLGFLLLRLEQMPEAEASLREALRYNPALAVAHYHLGRALEKEGHESEAIDEYRRSVALDASSTDACYSLALLYRKLHRENDAEASFAEYRRRREAESMRP